MIHNNTDNQLQSQLPQQKGGTITNSRMFTNKATNVVSHRERNAEKTRSIKQTYTTNYSTQNEHNQDDKGKYKFTNHALHYAVEQHLPPINIKCEPKIKITNMVLY